MTTHAQQFGTRKAAHSYLIERGFKIPYRTFVDHCKESKCVVESDRKTILLSSLIAYIDKHLDRSGQSSTMMANEKARLELEDLREKIEDRRLKNRKEDRRWILREDADADSAQKILLIYNAVMTRLNLDKEKLLHAAGADSGRAADLVFALQASIDRAFNELANADRFDVQIQDEEFAEEID